MAKAKKQFKRGAGEHQTLSAVEGTKRAEIIFDWDDEWQRYCDSLLLFVEPLPIMALEAAPLSTGSPRLGAPELTQRHAFAIRPSHHHTLDAAPLKTSEPRFDFEWKEESIEPPRANWRDKLPKGTWTKAMASAFIALYGDPPVLPSEVRAPMHVVKANIKDWLWNELKRDPDPKTLSRYIRCLRGE